MLFCACSFIRDFRVATCLVFFKITGLDYNVIGIDWRELQGGMAARLDLIGNHTARFLKGMSEDFGLQLSDVHAIGFSYGTHVIGKCTFVHNIGI